MKFIDRTFPIGSWENRQKQLIIAGMSVKKQQIAKIIAQNELEPDDFFTAEQKAVELIERGI